MVGKSVSSVGEQLRAIDKMSGKRSPQLSLPPIPEELAGLWCNFIEIKNLNGDISLSTLKDWQLLTGEPISPFNVKLMLELESVYKVAVNG